MMPRAIPGGPSVSESERQPVRRRWYQFRISAIALIPALLVLGIFMIPVFLTTLTPEQLAKALGHMVGSWIFRVIVALIGAWLIGMLFRGSRVATTVAFSLLVVFCPAGLPLDWKTYVGVAPAPEMRRALDDVRASNDDFIERNRRMLEEEGATDTESGADHIGRNIRAIEAAAGSKTDVGSRTGRATAKVLREMQAIQSAYESDLAEFLALGGFDPPAQGSTPEDVNARLELVKRMRASNEDMLAFLRGLDGNLRAEMAREGLSASEQSKASQSFMRGAKAPLLRRVRETDLDLLDAGEDMLTILRDTLGQWTEDETTIWFDEDIPTELIDEYSAAAARLNQAAAEQAQAQAKLFGAQLPEQQAGSADGP